MKRIAVLVIAAMCALSIAGLAGCGGSGSSSAASSGSAASASASASASSSSAATKTDEQLIKEDFESMMKTALSPDTVGAAMEQDESMSQVFAMLGMDSKEYAQLICDAITFEVKDVKVNGDEATATVVMTAPDFDANDELMNQKLAELTQGIDVENVTEEQVGKLMSDLIKSVMTDPNLVTTSQEFEVGYAKVNGTWTMNDQGDAQTAMSSIISGS